MSGPSVRELAARTDPHRGRVAGLVRRMIARVTTGVWQLAGVRGLDGSTEVVRAEVFSGVGFAARPPASSSAEVVVVNLGSAEAPVVVATRDEKTAAAVRQAIGGLDAGDTLVFNGAVIVWLRAGGTVEIRSPGGTAGRLATLEDIMALRDWVAALPVGGTGSATLPGCPTPAGTTVLRGE